MNYGKENAAKRSAQLAGRGKRKHHSAGLAIIRISLICIVSVFIAGGIFAYLYAKNLISQLPEDVSKINISPSGYLSKVYDSDGHEIETLAATGSNRTYVKLENIPENLQNAFIAIEDSRFREHNGVDVQGIIRAAYTGVTNGFDFSQGASTITQQLLKNNYFTTWTSEHTFADSLNRKIQEQYLAIQVEKVVSKDTILENYLNSINLGQNTLGVESASQRYFGKSVSDLSLSECAVIAGITQNPSKYNPISHPEDNAKRRKKVLNKMLEQGYISEAEYNEAISDDVYDRIQVANTDYGTSSSTSYFVDALTDQVIDDLQNKLGYSETEAYSLLYAGGLSIYSTQDTRIQGIVDEEVNNTENYNDIEKISFSYRLTITKADGSTANYSDITMLSYYQASDKNYTLEFDSKEEAEAAIEAYKADIMEPGDEVLAESKDFTLQPQAAMTVMDQSTGQVVALIGGRGDKLAAKTLNRATGITRQPGSTFKVVACYAAALDAGGMTLASVENDMPTTYADGTKLSNYNKEYLGWTNIRTAITYSINVVTVEVMQDIGTSLGYQYAQNLGITTLTDTDNNAALALGGITKGVTNLDLTTAYATIANGGEYNSPIFYTTVVDHQGNIILDNRENQSKRVLKETTAWLLTSAMEDVMTTGTGKAANFDGMAVAGKSGTTTKNKDTVFAGYTPYYTAVIWGGFDDNTPQSYTTYSKIIWKAVMSRIHENLEYKDFTKPSGIVTKQVCKKSGKLAIPGVCDCDPRGSQVYTEYFEEGTEPTETCDHHYVGNVCTATHMFANSECPAYTGVFILGAAPGTADAAYGLDATTFGQYCPIHGGYPLPNSGAIGGGGAIAPASPAGEGTVEVVPATPPAAPVAPAAPVVPAPQQ
ncbi:MAG: PBP1A family penicillin-binding protein [Pseudobutyrivibrio sp.]|jgi:penicillin-binding protein 1A|uniref:transglycosylase domain-containing protein n=1 Tax=Pseudobutyrivibrio sp. TaxID=2014367 RepID=UPI0025DC33B4|nr:PBP1A family penicillin-binding protein [Pseudobutyrivibrio sp.]MBE5903852.1 PBP1A family penicillin-binding protein [Pseudobutyrivibrio sp.]